MLFYHNIYFNMKNYFFKKIKYIILMIIIISLLSIIYILNTNYKKRTYIIAPEIDIYEENEVDIYNQYEIEKLKLIEAYNENKILVLTFDDGPGTYTEYLVEELEKRNITATFFILGSNVTGKEEILKKTAKNNEIAIHSYSHKLFTKLSNKEILEDIQKTEEIIYSVTGLTPNIIRVPYGSLNTRVSNLLLENGYTSVTWDIDSKDWNFRNVDKTYNYIMKYLKGNSIILMHDIYKTSVDCALKLIDDLKDQYTFVTLSTYLELIENNNMR